MMAQIGGCSFIRAGSDLARQCGGGQPARRGEGRQRIARDILVIAGNLAGETHQRLPATIKPFSRVLTAAGNERVGGDS